MMNEREINAALVASSEENPLWRALLQICDNCKEDEVTGACAPGLTDSAAHFNRGRLAMIVDFKTMLTQARTIAVEEAQLKKLPK